MRVIGSLMWKGQGSYKYHGYCPWTCSAHSLVYQIIILMVPTVSRSCSKIDPDWNILAVQFLPFLKIECGLAFYCLWRSLKVIESVEFPLRIFFYGVICPWWGYHINWLKSTVVAPLILKLKGYYSFLQIKDHIIPLNMLSLLKNTHTRVMIQFSI